MHLDACAALAREPFAWAHPWPLGIFLVEIGAKPLPFRLRLYFSSAEPLSCPRSMSSVGGFHWPITDGVRRHGLNATEM